MPLAFRKSLLKRLAERICLSCEAISLLRGSTLTRKSSQERDSVRCQANAQPADRMARDGRQDIIHLSSRV